MSKKIPLTVALMTYNRGGSYLREAIQGILNQTYRDFEFLILDNGSIDDTPQVVLSYKDDRIRYVRNPPGLSAFFNGASAVKISRSERLLITFDDDIMLPTMVERQMALMDSDPDIVGVWSNIQTINQDGVIIEDNSAALGKDQIYDRGEFLADFLSHQVWPIPCTLMFKKNPRKDWGIDFTYYGGTLPERVKKKIENVHGGDDVLTLVGHNSRGKIAFINDPLYKYRRHNQQDTHAVDPTRGILSTYKKIKKFIRSQSYISDEIRTTVDAFVMHYEVQHAIASTPDEASAKQSIRKISALFNKKKDAQDDATQYRILSTAILLSYYKDRACRERLTSNLPPPGPQYSTATRALYAWAQYRALNENLFASIPKESKIAILGSVFIASLLIHEARARGLHITCCLDSNRNRQHKTLLGVPIIPTAELASKKTIDYVFLSSEKDHEPYLIDYLSKLNSAVKISSWKTLCQPALEAHQSHDSQ